MSTINVVNDSPSEVLRVVREELNKVITDMTSLKAALDVDIGAVSGVTLTASSIAVRT